MWYHAAFLSEVEGTILITFRTWTQVLKKKRNFDLYVSTYRQWMSNKSGEEFSSFQHAWCTPWKLFGHAFFIFYFFMILTRGMNVSLPKFPSIPNFLQLRLPFAFQFLIHVFFPIEASTLFNKRITCCDMQLNLWLSKCNFQPMTF